MGETTQAKQPRHVCFVFVPRYLAFHFPFITERSMLAHLRAVPWRLDQDAFKAWRQGLTGYPLVDAGGWDFR
jgi:deoxyribodipyrimidine photolyase